MYLSNKTLKQICLAVFVSLLIFVYGNFRTLITFVLFCFFFYILTGGSFANCK